MADNSQGLELIAGIALLSYANAIKTFQEAKRAWTDHLEKEPTFDENEWFWGTGVYGEWDTQRNKLFNEFLVASDSLISYRNAFSPLLAS